MDVESTNGCHNIVGDASHQHQSTEHLNAIDDYETHANPIDLKQQQQSNEHTNFIFGNPAGSFVHETANVTIKTNGDGNNHGGFDDSEPEDDGPETDVDATDEGRFGGHSMADYCGTRGDPHEEFDYNIKNAHLHDPDLAPQNIPLGFDEDFVKKEEHQSNNPFDDNRLFDSAVRGVVGAYGDDDLEEIPSAKIDFSEKKEYSFEREDYEKESDPLHGIPPEVLGGDDDDDIDEHESHTVTTEVVTTEQHGE